MSNPKKKYLKSRIERKKISYSNDELIDYIDKYGYINVITPLKSLISIGLCENNNHVYEQIKDTEILKYAKKIKDINDLLIIKVTEFEQSLKNYITEAIREYLKSKKISFNELIDLISYTNNTREMWEKVKIRKLKNSIEKIVLRLNGNSDHTNDEKYWYIINNLVYSELITLLINLPEEILKYVQRIIKSPPNMYITTYLREIQLLRNSLLHNTPFLIYLQEGENYIKNRGFIPLKIKEDKIYNIRRRKSIIWIIKDESPELINFIKYIKPYNKNDNLKLLKKI